MTMPLSSRSHPMTCAKIGSVSRGQCHIYQNPTWICLSLFKESRDDTSFLIWTTRSPRITEDLKEDRGEYVARDTCYRRIFVGICSSQLSSPSINIRHPEELPSRAPGLQTSRAPGLQISLSSSPRPDLQISLSSSPEARPPDLQISRPYIPR
ncbi:hypothetical protein F511_20210 [Dorcoceras hygrometricum]|uniref:Uncharacterized protein n=1 Tax=Dorcoceras hygrometricum TaxID=472368 RepID=A0A2Z7BS70_9LAMI|nr:hypothetical protein F511_20210 [Dorcoceras hygrometricum]